jgi:uncharacterized protein (UPF0548 family)
MNWLPRWKPHDLTPWERRPFSVGIEAGPRANDNRDNHERIVGHEPPGPPLIDGIAGKLADAILRFDVFPSWMLTGVLRRHPIEQGDTVALRYRFLPGLDLFFAARVIERFEETTLTHWRSGFTYRTLEGHPECGEETFVVEKDLASGAVTVALRSWSRPGTWLAWLMYPIVRRWQLRAGRVALDHLQGIVNPVGESIPSLSRATERRIRTSLF